MGPEKTFEIRVKEFIYQSGGWYVKFFANKMTKSGIPDILACIDGYFVGIEIKSKHGKPSDLQIRSIKKIREAGGFAFVLYPSGFDKFKKFVMDLKRDKFMREMPLEFK